MGAFHEVRQGVGGEVELHVDVVSGVAEALETTVGDRFCHKYSGHGGEATVDPGTPDLRSGPPRSRGRLALRLGCPQSDGREVGLIAADVAGEQRQIGHGRMRSDEEVRQR